MGQAAQGALGSLAIGLCSIISDAKHTPGTSLYHLNGFDRLKPKQRQLLVTITIVSSILSQLQALIFADDRLLQQYEEIRELIREEIHLAHGLELPIWRRLGHLIDPEEDPDHPVLMRQVCLHTLHTAVAYVNVKVLLPMESYPWKLALCEPSTAAQTLSQEEKEPEDLATSKLWRLLKAGLPAVELQQVCKLLKAVPWSSILVEQAHGSAAVLQKFHPGLGLDQHLQRAYLHQCRHLFTVSEQEKQDLRLEAKIRRHERTPSRISGRNVFLQQLIHRARVENHGQVLSQDSMRRLMTLHLSLYSALTPEEKKHYETQAAAELSAKVELQWQDAQHLKARQRLGQARLQQEREAMGGVSNASRLAKFSDPSLSKLTEFFKETPWSSLRLQQQRARACHSVTAPDQDAQQFFAETAQSLPVRGRPDAPLWVKKFCEHRSDFVGLHDTQLRHSIAAGSASSSVAKRTRGA